MVSSHPLLTVGLLALASAFAPRLAVAQTATDPAVLAAAQAHFEQGLALARQQRWAEALAAFERSRATTDRPSTAFNAALALQHLGRVIEARRALEQCLAMPDAAADPELIRDATAVLATVRAAIATVTLSVAPERAELRVDGTPNSLLGPSRSLELDPGSHALNASAPGFVAQDLTLRLSPGDRESRSITLSPQPARLSIVAMPSGATVLIDGTLVGRGTAAWEGPPRTLGVRISAAGHATTERSVVLEPGEHSHLAITLTREARPLTANPWLWIGVGTGVAAVVTVVALLLIHPTADADGGTANRVLSGGP